MFGKGEIARCGKDELVGFGRAGTARLFGWG